MGFKMKYQIETKYLTPKSLRRPAIPMTKVSFGVLHDTGNKNSTATNNVDYYQRSRNEMEASAHTFIDDKHIIECIPLLTALPEKAWHVRYNVTADNQKFGDDANDIAGGVELCYGDNIEFEEAYKRYVWYNAYMAYKFKFAPTRFIGHHLLDPSRKTDPVNALKTGGKTYEQLLKDIVAEYKACTETAVYHTVKSGDTLWEIARDNKMTVGAILALNPKINPNVLSIGQKIRIK